MTDWEIREATVDYARDLAVCHIESWREAYRGLVPDHLLDAFDIDRRTRQWARIIAEFELDTPNTTAASTTTVLAVDSTRDPGDRVLGFAHAGPARDNPAPAERELFALYVRAAHHGTGVAADLMRAILLPDIDTALWVFEENPRAMHFYRKFGFAADGARRTEPISAAIEIRMIARSGTTARR